MAGMKSAVNNGATAQTLKQRRGKKEKKLQEKQNASGGGGIEPS